jgi:hypothetical protein
MRLQSTGIFIIIIIIIKYHYRLHVPAHGGTKYKRNYVQNTSFSPLESATSIRRNIVCQHTLAAQKGKKTQEEKGRWSG